MRELILGGQKSGKSRAAEARAIDWLGTDGHEACLIATAQAGDDEMTERIARHRADRHLRAPRLLTVEASQALAAVLTAESSAKRLVIVDCLTLWLTQLALPPSGAPGVAIDAHVSAFDAHIAVDSLVTAAASAPGPLVFVSNEIGLGVAPLSADARRFVDALGLLHQAIAAICDRVTLMVAGCEWQIRGPPP